LRLKDDSAGVISNALGSAPYILASRHQNGDVDMKKRGLTSSDSLFLYLTTAAVAFSDDSSMVGGCRGLRRSGCAKNYLLMTLCKDEDQRTGNCTK
jgi:hypothetical protein